VPRRRHNAGTKRANLVEGGWIRLRKETEKRIKLTSSGRMLGKTHKRRNGTGGERGRSTSFFFSGENLAIQASLNMDSVRTPLKCKGRGEVSGGGSVGGDGPEEECYYRPFRYSGEKGGIRLWYKPLFLGKEKGIEGRRGGGGGTALLRKGGGRLDRRLPVSPGMVKNLNSRDFLKKWEKSRWSLAGKAEEKRKGKVLRKGRNGSATTVHPGKY